MRQLADTLVNIYPCFFAWSSRSQDSLAGRNSTWIAKIEKKLRERGDGDMTNGRDDSASYAMVGIFWCVGGSVFGEAVPLDKGEPYGDALQHGGHYNYWHELKPQTVEERQFKAHAYDFYPRGRVVYFQSRRQFRLYADSCLSTENLQMVVDFFSLGQVSFEIESDAHYQCVGCNRGYLE